MKEILIQSGWEKGDGIDSLIPEDLKYHDTVYKDKEREIEITLPFYNRFDGYFGNSGNFGFFCQVKGENIDSITYSLNKGSFFHKTEIHKNEIIENEKVSRKECILKSEQHKDGCEYIGDQEKLLYRLDHAGSSYNVEYENQTNIEHQYLIGVENNDTIIGESNDAVKNVHNELERTIVTIEIHFNDGSIETRYIHFESIKGLEEYYAPFMKISISE